MESPGIVARGEDLTERDIAALAEDAFVVTCWAMRNKLKRADWQEQIKQAFRVRLGRREGSAPDA